ncbi:hypothetical protein MIMGU_mgv1a025385mg, partial [Erythranthe guttata]
MSCMEGFMSPQTETKVSVGFKASVKECHILTTFRITPHPGVPSEEAGVAVAAESSTDTWKIVLAHYCRDNGILLHIRRAMHAVIDRQKNHGKLEGEKDITLGFVDLLRDDFIEKDQSRVIYFTQDCVFLLGVIPVAFGPKF